MREEYFFQCALALLFCPVVIRLIQFNELIALAQQAIEHKNTVIQNFTLQDA